MRLTEIILENFRCYKNETRIKVDDLTAFIGVNDIGKSTILEALEIFFNNETVKIEKNDACIDSKEKIVKIGCIFSDFPEQIILDSTAITNFKQEYLLNEAGNLELWQHFDCEKVKIVPKKFVNAYYPQLSDTEPLITLKNKDLKKKSKDFGIDTSEISQNSDVSMRKAIFDHFNTKTFARTQISADDPSLKETWKKIEEYFPLFFLFKADRLSTDKDDEAQDPMKIAITQAVSSVKDQIKNIEDVVRKNASNVVNATLNKLKEIKPELAKGLTPKFGGEPKWDSIFKIELSSEKGIPLNKRGSGFRRLILLSFFLAEADRKKSGDSSKNIIYAIEEPEISQHPIHQKLLIEAFLKLIEGGTTQVLLTTHVPGIAKLIPVSALRHLTLNSQNEIQIEMGTNSTYKNISKDLGVLPDSDIQALFFVEGINDIEFLQNVSEILNHQDPSIINLKSDNRVELIPLGGANLKHWVDRDILSNLNKPRFYLFDRNNPSKAQYEDELKRVKDRKDGSIAWITNKLEMENYIHPDAVNGVLGISVSYGDNDDVPEIVAKAVHQNASTKSWGSLEKDKKDKKISQVKKRMNQDVTKTLTVNQIKLTDKDHEIETWLGIIKQVLK